MQWLETDFLGYLDKWDKVVSRPGFTLAEQKQIQPRDETLAGLRVTGTCVDICLL